MTDRENPMHTLSGYFRNVYNPNIPMTNDTCNGDRIIIVLSNSIERWQQFLYVKLFVDSLM